MPTQTHYWLHWKCLNCRKVNLGSRADVENCKGCGATRKTDYFYDEASYAPVLVIDPEDIDFCANAGPRWQCTACNTFVVESLHDCPNCGKDKADAPENEVRILTGNEQGNSDAYAGIRLVSTTPAGSHNNDYAPTSPPLAFYAEPAPTAYPDTHSSYTSSAAIMPQGGSKLGCIVLAIVMIVVAAASFFIVSKQNELYVETVSIDKVGWSRVIDIQQFLWTNKDSLSGFPDGSRNQDRRYEQVGTKTVSKCCKTEKYTESVYDGQECSTTKQLNGNGSMTENTTCRSKYKDVDRERQVRYDEQEPVYGYRYYYQVQEWRNTRKSTSGAEDWNPFWQEPTLLTGEEAERESGRTQNYCVHITYNEAHKYQHCTADEAAWRTYREGATVTYNGFNAVTSITPLQKSE